VIDPDHVQYCQLDLEEQARIIAQAAVGAGRTGTTFGRPPRTWPSLGSLTPILNGWPRGFARLSELLLGRCQVPAYDAPRQEQKDDMSQSEPIGTTVGTTVGTTFSQPIRAITQMLLVCALVGLGCLADPWPDHRNPERQSAFERIDRLRLRHRGADLLLASLDPGAVGLLDRELRAWHAWQRRRCPAPSAGTAWRHFCDHGRRGCRSRPRPRGRSRIRSRSGSTRRGISPAI
jgi:hypothetical protein